MGADARAYLFIGVPLEDIFTRKNDTKAYDIYDTKTGKKTGKKGFEEDPHYVNNHSGKRYELQELPIKEKYLHNLDQDSDDLIIAVQVGEITDGSGGTEYITNQKIEKAKKEFEEMIVVHTLLGNGLCAIVEPKQILNLYWSY